MQFLKLKRTIISILIITYCVSSIFPVHLYSEPFNESSGIKFNRREWKRVKKKKEKRKYEPKEVPEIETEVKKSTTTVDLTVPQVPEGISFELPYQSTLSISGRKSIGVKYGFVHYDNKEEGETAGTPSGSTKGFDMNQELQVRIKGKIGRKITVNVDYNDTTQDKRDISVVYKGHKKGDIINDQGKVAEKDEIIEEIAFGDINLSLPSTEFVGYSKNLFGIRFKAKYKNMSLMAIGSRTKGITETKKFYGTTTFEKKDIKDISYFRRKYYALYFDAVQFEDSFPMDIDGGDIKVYRNDGINTESNNQLAKLLEVGPYTNFGSLTPTTSNYFDLLHPGQDYVVDYEKGTISFKTALEDKHEIAINYKDKNGNWLTGSEDGGILLRDWPETTQVAAQQELKNYYYLGSRKIIKGTVGRDFILKVFDQNRQEVEKYEDVYNMVDIDFDSGMISFSDPKPFYDDHPNIYDIYSPQHHYIIYVEYYHRVKTFNVRPNLVVDSERITVDGEVLKKNNDYIIDYDIGFLTFLNESKIKRDSVIEVTYEYMPFGGQFQQTLVGLRGVYNISNKGSIGSTYLYSGASKPSSAPQIRSTPKSVSIIDVDANYTVDPKWLPFRTTFKGEVAQSVHNPNVFGKALIDNMEGIKQEDTLSMDDDMWQIARNPDKSIVQFNNVSDISWNNEEIRFGDINPDAEETETREQVLVIDYKLDQDKQASIVYPISSVGIDYAEKEFMEMWFYGGDNGEEVNIQYGQINEDADGDGILDTEDIDPNDGILNKGEDIGWNYNVDNSTITRGADNSELDTEDLDEDGELGEDAAIGDIFGTLQNPLELVETKSTGWRRFVTPMGIPADNPSTSDDESKDWRSIKHIRITIKNTTGSHIDGTIKINGLAAYS